MLHLERVSAERAGRLVISGVSLVVQPGEVLGLLGPNGAGKSSLLALATGELHPRSGRVLFESRPLASWPPRDRARRMAVLPQLSRLDFDFRVDEIVRMGRLPHDDDPRTIEQCVQQALRWVDAEALAARSYLSLSGGERQRVQCARVLAQSLPGRAGQLLMLDEPTSMLDPLHQHGVLRAASELAQRGVGVVVVLHDLNLAARYCDRIVLMCDGCIRYQGPPDAVLQPQPLKQVYGLEVLVQRHPERGHPVVIPR